MGGGDKVLGYEAGIGGEFAMIDRRALLGSMALTFAAGGAIAQDKYPSKPIRLIVSFPPGGPLDVMARLTAQMLSQSLGQMIVDNKPGAAERSPAAKPPAPTRRIHAAVRQLGDAGDRARALRQQRLRPGQELRADRHGVQRSLRHDRGDQRALQDRAGAAGLRQGQSGYAQFRRPQRRAAAHAGGNVQDADRRQHPGRTVPGASTLITDMLAGRIHGGFETTSVMLAHLHEGNIRGLAVLRDARIPELPDVPTMIESGVKGVEGSSWSGVLAPAGTPPPSSSACARKSSRACARPSSPASSSDGRRCTVHDGRGIRSVHRQRIHPHRRDHAGGGIEGAINAMQTTKS